MESVWSRRQMGQTLLMGAVDHDTSGHDKDADTCTNTLTDSFKMILEKHYGSEVTHSQQPPSQKISIAPVATNARSKVVLLFIIALVQKVVILVRNGQSHLPRLPTPCTRPFFPFLLPISPAKFQNEFISYSRLPPSVEMKAPRSRMAVKR